MQFKIRRPIVFFDIESTGLNVITDRIVQIALIKYVPNSYDPIELQFLINPGKPISKEAMDIHKITPDMLQNKPLFKDVAQQIFEYIGNADLAGYNSDRFDIPMLIEEFNRAGYSFNMENRNSIDVQKIFYKMEPRTLKAALKFYCDMELENAHDALADVRATVDVLKGQIEKYKNEDYIDGQGIVVQQPIENNIKKLSEFTQDKRYIDATMRLKLDNEGDVVFNFGKYKGEKAKSVLIKDPNYANWILNKDFSIQVKNKIKQISNSLRSEIQS